MSSMKFGAFVPQGWKMDLAGIAAGADYGIVYIPGLPYDLDLLHRFEECVIAKLGK